MGRKVELKCFRQTNKCKGHVVRRLHLKNEQLGLGTEYILKMQRGTKSLDILGHLKNIGLGLKHNNGNFGTNQL